MNNEAKKSQWEAANGKPYNQEKNELNLQTNLSSGALTT